LFWYDRKTNDKTIQNSLGEKPWREFFH
jgi:hypothetical protein